MSTIQTAAPVIPFRQSRTYGGLQDALRDKRRARQLYLDAARTLTEDGQQVIAHAFRFTAAQEGEHAAILAQMADAPADAPPACPDTPSTAQEALAAALERESACAQELFPAAAREAEAARQPRAAAALRRIAENEAQHARRLAQYSAALADGSLFCSATPVSWVCLACGGLQHGCHAPASCEGCGASGGHFIRSSFHPFALS